jgi:hypothetical protein
MADCCLLGFRTLDADDGRTRADADDGRLGGLVRRRHLAVDHPAGHMGVIAGLDPQPLGATRST